MRFVLRSNMLVLSFTALVVSCLCVCQPASAVSAARQVSAGAESTPWPGGIWQPEPAKYGVVLENNVKIAMNDGVLLNATVAYPADPSTGTRAPGKFPVLLDQTAYSEQPVDYFVERGYIFVLVNARGTGASGGSFGDVGPRDHEDGVETLEWAGHDLPGSNGVVGGYGCSWDGETQLYTAANVGPNSPLKAIVPACTAQDYIRETFLNDGLLTADFPFLQNAAVYVGDTPSAQALYSNLVADVETGGDDAFNREFWQVRQPIDDAWGIARNRIPTLLWTGWDDVVFRGTTEFYTALQNLNDRRPEFGPMVQGQRATGRYQIIVGPWGHGQGLDDGIMLEWYDTWLKGERTGIQDTRTPMHMYEMASDRWINTADWPAAPTYTRDYLNSGGTLTARPANSPGGDTISWEQPTDSGGTLEYTTHPFLNGATLAGPTSATIYASSSNTNLELIGSLYDVAPDGTENLISYGDVLGSQSELLPSRNWYDDRGTLTRPYTAQFADRALTAGETQPFSIALNPAVWSIAPGDSLRLVITTQSPTLDCTNFAVAAGVVPCSETGPDQLSLTGGVYQIDHSHTLPSSVALPLLPHLCFSTADSGATPTSGTNTEPLDWASSRSQCVSSPAVSGSKWRSSNPRH
jgi:predicted acyl esterase